MAQAAGTSDTFDLIGLAEDVVAPPAVESPRRERHVEERQHSDRERRHLERRRRVEDDPLAPVLRSREVSREHKPNLHRAIDDAPGFQVRRHLTGDIRHRDLHRRDRAVLVPRDRRHRARERRVGVPSEDDRRVVAGDAERVGPVKINLKEPDPRRDGVRRVLADDHGRGEGVSHLFPPPSPMRTRPTERLAR